MIETHDITPCVILVGISTKQDLIDIESSMQELRELAEAADFECCASLIQNKAMRDRKFYVGPGKVEEIKALCEVHDADYVIMNDELSGSQIRNLEEALGVDVLDRTGLILEIFARRAHTAEGKLQVELARLNYELPRLVGEGKGLSRLGGGIGSKGLGEQKLELDRRHLKHEIQLVKEQLEALAAQRETNRKRRLEASYPIVALVGYTNAGKSTIMNRLLEMDKSAQGTSVFVQDMLFATLDPKLRLVTLNDRFPILLTDTVGFVSKLPHTLVDAFKSTLEELVYADLLIHVVDASNPNLAIQMDTTMEILKTMNVLNTPMLTVYNKMDKALNEPIALSRSEKSLSIAAVDDSDMRRLSESIEAILDADMMSVRLHIPYEKSRVLDNLSTYVALSDLEHDETGTGVTVRLSKDDLIRYDAYRVPLLKESMND